MNEPTKKDRMISLGITIAVHVLILLLLIFLGFRYQAPEEESGVLLMVGEVELSSGNDHVASAEAPTPQTTPTPPAPPSTPSTPTTPTPPLITSTDDAPVLSEEEKAEEEAKRKAAEEAEAKRKAAQNLVSGAFGKNSGTATTGSGAQGSPNGNSAVGASHGSPGYGQYDLGGRGIVGSLPRPSFDVNASGKVVVKITVNAQGQVIGEEITTGTNTTNQVLRKAALEAARKARFSVAEGAGNQQGTITYLFDSNN